MCETLKNTFDRHPEALLFLRAIPVADVVAEARGLSLVGVVGAVGAGHGPGLEGGGSFWRIKMHWL